MLLFAPGCLPAGHAPDLSAAPGLVPPGTELTAQFFSQLSVQLADAYGIDCSPPLAFHLIGSAQAACRQCQELAAQAVAAEPLHVTMLMIITADIHLQITGQPLPYLIGGQGGLHGTAMINAATYAALACYRSVRSDPGHDVLTERQRARAITWAWAAGLLEHAHVLTAQERRDVTEALLDMAIGMLTAPEYAAMILGVASGPGTYREELDAFRTACQAVTALLHDRMRA